MFDMSGRLLNYNGGGERFQILVSIKMFFVSQ